MKLDNHRRFWGLLCKAGTEVDEVERSGTLAEDTLFRGVVLPADSTFYHDIDYDNFVVTLAAATTVYDHRVAAGSKLDFSPRVEWWSLDRPLAWLLALVCLPFIAFKWLHLLLVRSLIITPASDLVIGEITVRPGERVWLRADGTIESVLPSAPIEVNGIVFEAGWLRFDRRGRLRKVQLHRDQRIRGLPCLGSGVGRTELGFHENGALSTLVLAEETTLEGKSYPRGTRLWLDPEGRVKKSRRPPR